MRGTHDACPASTTLYGVAEATAPGTLGCLSATPAASAAHVPPFRDCTRHVIPGTYAPECAPSVHAFAQLCSALCTLLHTSGTLGAPSRCGGNRDAVFCIARGIRTIWFSIWLLFHVLCSVPVL